MFVALTGSEFDADDLAQETILVADGSRDVLPDTQPECDQYVCGMGRNVLRNWKRGEARRRRYHVRAGEEGCATGSPPGPGPAETAERRDLVRKAAARLKSPSELEAFQWLVRARFGDTHAAIAGEIAP